MLPRKKRFKRIHFVFDVHSPGSRYFPFKRIPLKTKTLIIENYGGFPRGRKLKAKHFSKAALATKKIEWSTYQKEKEKIARRFLGQGKNVRIGETLTRKEREEFKHLKHASKSAWDNVRDNPTLEKIRNYYHAETAIHALRHRAIRRTVRSAYRHGKTPILGRYGSMHSTLANELLAKDRLRMSRTIENQLFDWHEIVKRKLLLGIEPSEIEYLRAYASEHQLGDTFTCYLIETAHAASIKPTTKTWFTFLPMLENALVENLSASQLKEALKTTLHTDLFTRNGLPLYPTLWELMQFVQRKSIYFRSLSKEKQRALVRKFKSQ